MNTQIDDQSIWKLFTKIAISRLDQQSKFIYGEIWDFSQAKFQTGAHCTVHTQYDDDDDDACIVSDDFNRVRAQFCIQNYQKASSLYCAMVKTGRDGSGKQLAHNTHRYLYRL